MNREKTLRLTPLGLLPALAAAVLGGLAVLTGDSWLLLMAGGALGLLGAAVLLRPRLTGLCLFVLPLSRAVVGDEVSWHAHVTNQSKRRTSLARLTHSEPGLADLLVLVPPLPPGDAMCVNVKRAAVARTAGQSGSTRTTSSEPLGMLLRVVGALQPTELIVHPRLVPVRLADLQATESGGGQAVADRAGLDIHGIREWRSGDGAAQVHWRSTARRGRLVVLERETQLGAGFSLIVIGPPGQPSWEPLVALAASTAVAAAASGRRVGIFATQGQAAELISVDRTALLDWFAGLGEPTLPSAAILGRALRHAGSGGDLVVAATWVPPDWWTSNTLAARAAGVTLRILTSEPGR